MNNEVENVSYKANKSENGAKNPLLKWESLKRTITTFEYVKDNEFPKKLEFIIEIPDFEIASGEVVVMTGDTGVGKTTILSALGIADLSFNGKVHIAKKKEVESENDYFVIEDGKSHHGNIEEIRKRIGIVFQDLDSHKF